MKKVLQPKNMKMTTVENGHDPPSLLKEDLVDVAVVDIEIQGMTELEVLKRFTQNFLSFEVIFLASYSTVGIALEGK